MPTDLKEIAIGMILSDACMYKVSNQALIKFDQGYVQREFLLHLFFKFKSYCFMLEPGKRIISSGPQKGNIKSLWFKTFSHFSFTEIWDLFYVKTHSLPVSQASHRVAVEGKIKRAGKTIQEGLILNNLTNVGLAYWIMGDGSLQSNKKTMILHTQSYTKTENLILSKELNEKFKLNSEVIRHKKIYWVIKFKSKDAVIIKNLIEPFIIPSMVYKIPLV